MRIRWTDAAVNDLKAISAHIERDRNLATANRVCRTIYDAVQTLRHFSKSVSAGIEEGTRELVVGKLPTYRVTYRLASAAEILRI